jgi:O-antigen/teichoic acid export membrane protein
MEKGIEQIGKKSVAWSYTSVFFSVGSGLILLPFILHAMPSGTIAIWTIFQTIYALTMLLDFGFRPSFARNLSYVFSGVEHFSVNGVEKPSCQEINYVLLKDTLQAMKMFYRWVAIVVFALLITVGTWYFMQLMSKYSGDKDDAIIAWILLVSINCYNVYTLYYDSLLTGKGYISQLQKITILGQSVYLCLAIILILCGMQLSAIVLSQALSVVIKRVLSYKVFYNAELRKELSKVQLSAPMEVLRIIAPNAVKVGLTSFGSYIVNRSSMFIGAIYLSLDTMAQYGVCLQIMDIMARCGTMMFVTYSPKIAQWYSQRDMQKIGRVYIYSVSSLLIIYLIGGLAVVLCANPLLDIINSNTHLLPTRRVVLLIVINFLEQNHGIAGGFIQAGNQVPFFIPSLLSGLATIVLLWVFLDLCDMGVIALILAPGIAQLVYQNWKWPMVVIKEIWGRSEK